jgi:hypothetical protein
MLAVNTYAGYILMVMVMLYIASVRYQQQQTASTSQLQSRTPSTAAVPCTSLPWSIHRTLLFFACFHSLRILLTMINATLQRRHLMVWAIFAPKYVFDGVATLVMDILALVVAYVAQRLN